MRTFTAASASLLFAAATSAQSVAEIAQALTSLNLTSLVSAVEAVNGTAVGQALLASLGTFPQTVFAPTNDAFAAVPSNVSSDADLLANIISYHVLPGTFNSGQTYPNTTIGRTLLSHNSSLVFLEGDKNQVLAWSNINGSLRILNQKSQVSVVNSTSVGNITVNVVDAVISVPGDLTTALDTYNLTSLSAALTQLNLLDTLNTAHGFTLFAPSNEAFAAAQDTIASVSNNATLLTTVLLNHVVSGETVYSGNLEGGASATSAAGEKFGAVFNATGNFVSSGSTTAKVVTPDVLLQNGVIHIIDHVFLNEDSDAAAASSAASAASSAATVSATQTGPIGFTPSPTSTSKATGSSSSSNKNGAGRSMGSSFFSAGLIGAFGIVAGAVLVL